MPITKANNHLADETSPYLLQHANNPVDWYPWNKEALARAKKENKPILLSIGYAACHWCHVMAHESFEDEETAKLMNELFINIKVDREERPDLDKIYQTAHYLLTQQSGGWPLTIFLTPEDLTPFFSGTYFPKTARYNLPAFKDVLTGISQIYKNRHQDIEQQNNSLQNLLRHSSHTISEIHLDEKPISLALHTLQQHYDYSYGGFDGAPKFPRASKLEFLLYNHSSMAIDTLRHMAEGGIYDQLEGGFYRYAVDAKWQIPHFEKMLYDNGQLLLLYSLAAKEAKDEFFSKVAKETAWWLIHKMQSPEGGYYSSIDADSQGQEGKFYIWNAAEVESLLSKPEYDVTRLYFGLDQTPNFEYYWHLFISQPLDKVAKRLDFSLAKARELLSSAKEKLLIARNKRIAPARDEKILTSWNSLTIKGMVIAGDYLEEPAFLTSAKRAIDFIREHLWVNKRLLASYKDGKAHLSAYLDDYAFLLDALLTYLQVKWDTDYLTFAIELADEILTYFPDEASGGFFFTANDHEKLLYRPKTMMDEAIPSGNAIAVKSLLILGHLLGETRYLDAVEKTLKAAQPALAQYPAEHCALLLGLHEFLQPSPLIVIRGKDDQIEKWRKKSKTFTNHVFAIPNEIVQLPSSLQTRKPHGDVCAYVCQGTECSDVITEINKLAT